MENKDEWNRPNMNKNDDSKDIQNTIVQNLKAFIENTITLLNTFTN